MPLSFAYEQASAARGIDFVRIESQARAAGITDTSSPRYLEFAMRSYLPMLQQLERAYHEAYMDVRLGSAARMTFEDVREAVAEMDESLEQASTALDRAIAEGQEFLGMDSAPTVTAQTLARYALALNVLAFEGRMRHESGALLRAARDRAVSVERVLADANNIALTYEALIEMKRSGAMDAFVVKPGATSGLGAAAPAAAGAGISAWALIAITIAVVSAVALLAAAAVAAYALAEVADLLDKYCFDEEGEPRRDQRGQLLCEGLPQLMPQVLKAFMEPAHRLAERLGYAALVAAGIWAGARFLLPAVAKQLSERSGPQTV